MVYLVTIRGNAARDDVQVVVVRIVVGIDENGLSVLSISHFFEIPMGNVQKLLVGVFVTSATNGEMKLGLLDASIAFTIFNKVVRIDDTDFILTTLWSKIPEMDMFYVLRGMKESRGRFF